MMYRVLGYSKENAKKMTVEIEAQSKAEAEKKAIGQNLEVIRVELASEAAAREASTPTTVRGRRSSGGGMSGITKLMVLLLVLALAGAAYLYWPEIMALVGKKG